MRTFSVCSLALVGLLLVACQGQPGLYSDTTASPFVPTASYELAPYVPGPDRAPLSVRDVARRTAYADSVVFEALSTAQTWQDADHAVRLAIVEAPEAARLVVEQAAAVVMIQNVLPERGDGVAEAGAFYTRALVEHDSPEGSVVLAGLERFSEAFDADERQRLAAHAVPAVEAALQRSCAGCGPGRSLAPTDVPSARYDELTQALGRLHEIAAGG